MLRLTADRIRPARGLDYVHSDIVVAAPLESTFEFFADAANLQKLTPPWLSFQILSRGPVTMREGLEIEYRIALYGVPVPWLTRIDVWEPGSRFVDRQLIGPYRWWHHEHRFEATDAGTRVIDHVEFLPRARWISRRLVRRDVTRIFAYRRQRLQQIFGTGASTRG
jgi:ligand-binding SRPBCC domain-containing protein